MASRKYYTYQHINDLKDPPRRNGTFEVYANAWWFFVPGKGLVFWGEGTDSPQCAKDKIILERVLHTIKKELPDTLQIVQVELAYVPHRCAAF